MDAHLALSKSVDENEFIAVEVGRPESRVWIGLRRIEGEFVWSDGSKSDFTNWHQNEPKNGKDCVSLLPEDIFYSWEVRDRDERQGFICERGKVTIIFSTGPLIFNRHSRHVICSSTSMRAHKCYRISSIDSTSSS